MRDNRLDEKTMIHGEKIKFITLVVAKQLIEHGAAECGRLNNKMCGQIECLHTGAKFMPANMSRDRCREIRSPIATLHRDERASFCFIV